VDGQASSVVRRSGGFVLATDLRRLLAAPGWPAVSILCPAGRVEWPSLVAEAQARLGPVVDDDCARALLDGLERAAGALDTGDWPAFGVFASPRLVHAVSLPQPVRPRVVLDETFATRDLVSSLARTPRYLVLTIDGAGAQLWAGLGGRLAPAPEVGGFPVRFPVAPDAGERRHHQERSKLRDAHLDRCHRLLDEALVTALEPGDRRPLFLVGSGRRIHRYATTSPHSGRFAATVAADPASPKTILADLIAGHLDRELAERGDAAVEAVGAAIGANRFAAGLPEVWGLAHDGRIGLLAVEDDYHQPAITAAVTSTIELCDEPCVGGIDDAVDEVIEAVLAAGGDVHLVPSGALAAWDRIAASLRH
jgi:hypothetical protein